jgi:hypothetical protein
MTSRVSPGDSADVSPGVPQTSTETRPDIRLTSQAGDEMHLPNSGPDSQSEQAGDDHVTHRSGRSSAWSSSGQDLRTWAAALAATLPPLTESQVAGVARMAAQIDAKDRQKPAA